MTLLYIRSKLWYTKFMKKINDKGVVKKFVMQKREREDMYY